MVKPTLDERRQSNRAKRILSIQFRLVKSRNKNSDTKWHLSTTHDMSVSGLSFLADVSYNIDDVLELHVVMSGILDIFKGYGRVVRIEKKSTGAFYLIAVRFVKSPTTTRKPRATAKSKSKNRIKKSLKK